MEPTMAAFHEEEWESLGKMFTSEEGADFMLQLNDFDAGLFFEAPSNFWPVSRANIENVAGVGESFFCNDNHSIDYANLHNVSQESSYGSGSNNSVVLPELIPGFHLANEMSVFQAQIDSSESMVLCVMDERNENSSFPVIPNGIMSHIVSSREEMGNDKFGHSESQTASLADSGNELLLKRKFAKSKPQTEAEDSKFNSDSVETPKKARISRNQGQKNNKRNVLPKPKKNQKAIQNSNKDEENNAVQNGQSCCTYSSEDDSNASQDSNGGEASENKEPALNLNGKTRASRGSATDPQSLYARRRRERINERLRILQNLIPNGTKVDISTMLEEAVHYVKFLQLQIKLLSSDDTWMYAPIVYNGLDIGLYGRIFPTQ